MKNGKIIINLNIKKYQESDYAFLGTFFKSFFKISYHIIFLTVSSFNAFTISATNFTAFK